LIVVLRDNLIKVGREFAQEKFRVSLKQGDQDTIEFGNVVSVALLSQF
jgi:hypothetical protein